MRQHEGDIRIDGLGLQDYLQQLILSNPFVPPKGDRCPINDLPNELLAYIFLLGTSADDDDEDDDMYQDEDDELEAHLEDPEGKEWLEDGLELPFQVLVSHVCKHWREVAIEAPALWTAIKFSDDEPPFTRCETWIERSKGLPIDITIDCTLPADGTDSSAMSDVPDDDEDEEEEEGGGEGKPFFTLEDLTLMLSIITPHVTRWRGLEILVDHYTYMHLATTILATLPSAPSLEVLQLYHYEHIEIDYDIPTEFKPAKLRDPFPVLFSGNAPKLSHIALWGVHIAWPMNKNAFMTDLKDLELAYHADDVRPSWEDFERMLLTSPVLDTLTLCHSGPSGKPGDWYSNGPIDLSGLKNLVLAYHKQDYICSLLNLLHIPNVTSLALDFESEAGDFSLFVQQLASPRPGTKRSLLKGLEHLKISSLPCEHRVVDVMYAQLGNLHSINLACTFLDKIFFTKLRQPIQSSSAATAFYCPNLDTITTSGIPGREMCDFVEARRKAGVPVKRVFMSDEDDLDDNDEAWLRAHLETFDLFEPSDEESDEEVSDVDMD
jgi:hypothetical protein